MAPESSLPFAPVNALVADHVRLLRADHLARGKRRHAHLSRRDETALSWEAAAWIVTQAEVLAEAARGRFRVLEAGSGFSTTVLREWQQRTPARVPVEVWTTDLSWPWLGRTAFELELRALSTDHLHQHEVFDCLPGMTETFDLVLCDLGSTSDRLSRLDRFMHYPRPGGLLVFDDWHMAHYTAAALPRLRKQGFEPVPILETTDHHGRHLAACHRP